MSSLRDAIHNKDQFIDLYLEHIFWKQIMPNVYCSKPYLKMRSDVVPFVNSNGFIGFKRKQSRNLFFIPPIIEENGSFNFVKNISEIEFPGDNCGKERYDVQVMYLKENSLRIMRSDHDLRKYFDLPIECFALPYTSDKYKAQLDFYYEYLTTRYIDRNRITDFKHFKDMLFNDYGQKRFVMLYKDVILAVLLWSDNGQYVNIHYGLGFNYMDYNDTHNIRKKEVSFSPALIRYFFMQRFPPGTMFNDGGVGVSSVEWRSKYSTKPCAIYEIRTSINNFKYVSHKGEVLKPVGIVPVEGRFLRKYGETYNDLLFSYIRKIDKEKIKADTVKKIYDRNQKVNRRFKNVNKRIDNIIDYAINKEGVHNEDQ